AGGEVLDARVLDAAGRLQDGKAILFGPVAWFVGPDAANTGLVQEQLNRADPALFPLPEAASGLRDIALKGEGGIPLDATLGNAAKIAGIRLSAGERILSDFVMGGIVMWPLAFLAFSALGIGA
ncbi:MAG TPA: hypothetical protein PKE47_09605, partial [Verrucomicrobiota bacterium]|nr:hypothetical protein [Verrucomicrobiota bacterium]